jgi:hypothetical protein
MEDDNGLPTRPYHLLVAFNVLEPEKIKYFLSNGPEDTPVETLLLVAFSRWKIERMFEDGKSELGLGHFEVRKFQSIQRHLILSCVSYLFLAKFHQAHRGEKPGPDVLPGADGDGDPGAAVDPRRTLFRSDGRVDRGDPDPNPTTQRRRGQEPSQAETASVAQHRIVSGESHRVQMASSVAL